MRGDEIKKASNLILLVLASLTIGLCVRHTYAEELPPFPDEAKNILPLSRTFKPAIGSGIHYLNSGKILQMSDAKEQCGAIWSKKKINLASKFEMSFFLYLGNRGADAGDGMTFCLQNYNERYVGEKGEGLGAYSAGANKLLALEFDTFYNNPGPDCSYTVPYRGTHHIAFCYDEPNWKVSQSHYGVSDVPKMLLSNGYWKKVTVFGDPVSETGTKLSYKVEDLIGKSKSRTYANSYIINFKSTFGTNKVYWGFTSSTGENFEKSALAFEKFPQMAIITTRNVTLFKGEHWNPSQNFVSASDEEGGSVTLEDGRLTSTNNVKTDTPGTYEVTYNYRSKDELYTQTATAKVTVLEDKTNLCTQDTILRVGEKWDPAANFVSAADEAGNSVPWGDSRIDINGATVDTTKPGVAHLKYTIKGKVKTVDSSFTVTVLKNKTSLRTRDTTLKKGQMWNPAANFVSATDEAGNSVPWGDPRIDINGATVDTKHFGTTKLKYTMRGKGKNVDSSFTVTVLSSVQLSVPATCDFGTYRLGDSNPVLPWKKSSKVEVKGDLGVQWQLSVSLNSGSSLKGYFKLGNKLLSKQSQKVINGSGPMDVSDSFSSNDFIKVDYTGVKEKRKDTGVLEWNLTPSTKKVRE